MVTGNYSRYGIKTVMRLTSPLLLVTVNDMMLREAGEEAFMFHKAMRMSMMMYRGFSLCHL